jgi:tRNA-specific 2-thiouridylase
MSGGVDSSVAALVLKERGLRVVGVTMKLVEEDDDDAPPSPGSCCSLADVADARAVALKLDIDHQVHNFSHAFRTEVVEPFIAAYLAGRTPNPCIECNRRLKFPRLQRRAPLLDCDLTATGHYARIERDGRDGRWLLKKGLDEDKDQSYVLYAMTQPELARTLFPLGALRKEQVRRLAAERRLTTADKPDSQDLCFVRHGRYAEWLERAAAAARPGPLVDRDGRTLGRHQGIHRFTVGQRRGLGLSAPRPLYVTDIDPAANAVTVGPEEELARSSATIVDVNLIAFEELKEPLAVTAKLRYRQKDFPAVVEPLAPGRARLVFDRPQKGVAPGQAAVFYHGDVVVGGGTIDSSAL